MTLLRIPTAVGLGILFAVLIGQGGCSVFHGLHQADIGSEQELPRTNRGRQIRDYGDLMPDSSPGKTASMVMAGTPIRVELSTEETGTQFRILLKAHQQTFESESYQSGPCGFSLVEASGDKYSPDLDLIRFPMSVGDVWNWEGVVSSGDIRRKATATVRSESTNLYLEGAPVEAVKVSVDLALFSEGAKLPANRKLVFEFVPNRGLVRREFGDASVREPAPR